MHKGTPDEISEFLLVKLEFLKKQYHITITIIIAH